MAAAIAAYDVGISIKIAKTAWDGQVWLTFWWTTECSPQRMTFPGAETMNAGAIGLEGLRSIFRR